MPVLAENANVVATTFQVKDFFADEKKIMRGLFAKAFESVPSYDGAAIFDALETMPTNYVVITLLSYDSFSGYGLLFGPCPPLNPRPVLFSHYAPRSASDRKILNEAIVKQVKLWGAESFTAIDHWNKFDAFIRLFRDLGDGRYLGTEIEFVV